MKSNITVKLNVSAKWWMRPALWLSFWALRFRLIHDKPSDEHFGGIITAQERAARWLANYAFRMEAR